ncbi:uncharacterized protein LOC110464584 [Mizuhopecten yessoensis]|uniref:Double-strand-break repair protein rad21-like n=1 Tax=Mizuhopecten yessoensis TaxID=6573 RepID=A0A210PTM8_MIZYE|nr:uncharacterized protein LOC110464584 [Mizuhopecten yessoensis]OWF39815.1 Double-strand-break repair protein rad21-like [Mizuhopecten yessoensis]
METESAEPTATVVKVETPQVSVVNESKKGEVTDGQVVEQVNTENKAPGKEVSGPKTSNDHETPGESGKQVNTIIGEDEDGEAIDMADIRVLEDLDTENKSPEKEEVEANKAVKVESEEEEDKSDPAGKKRKSFEFFYPDMVSTLELALRGLPSMANCQQSKASIPQKGPPPKGPLQKGSVQKRPTPIRDFAKEAKKALKKSGNIIEVRATRKSTRTAVNLTKPVNNTRVVATTKIVSPATRIVSPATKIVSPATKIVSTATKVVNPATKVVSPKKLVQPVVLLDRVQGTEPKDIQREISPEPVAKKPRNTPKAAGKKSKVMPQAVAKQVKIITQVEMKPAPVKVTTPKVKVAPTKPCPETYVVAPGGHHQVIKYPLTQSNTVFRPSVPRSREWRKKGPGRSSRSKGCGLIVDKQKEIPTVMMKMRVSDTSDIVTSLDLAPPTKRLMKLKETEGSKETIKLFSIPGRNLTPRLAWPLFYPNLTTKPRGDDSDSDDDDMGDDMAAEEEDPNKQKKCFTIIRSEPLDLSDSEDNIHYTNVLSDEEDDNVGPVYEPTPINIQVKKIKVEQTDSRTVSMDTSEKTTVIIEETATDSNQQKISASMEKKSSGQKQETPSSVSEKITPQTVPALEAAPLVVQGEVTMVEASPQLVANVSYTSGSNSAVVNTEVDTSVVDISLTSVGASEAETEAVSVNQTASVGSNSAEEDGCVIVSVVTEIAEPYVEHEGEITIQSGSTNSSEDRYILYVEK